MNRTNTRRIKQEPRGDISPLVHRQASAVPQSPRSASTIMSDDDSIMTGAGPEILGARSNEEHVASVHHPSASFAGATHFGTPSHHVDQDAMTDASDESSIDILGRKVKALVQAIDKLQSLGIETKGLPLPKIVVVGDQSAGKSSLIEGISGIRVPRSAGTCTRCPLQITLTPADAYDPRWSCTLTIQKKFDLFSSTELDENGKPSPFGPWKRKNDLDVEDVAFAQTYDKGALEDLIRRAQFACLNPGDATARYLSTPNVENLSLKVAFSPNIVKLDIKDPSAPSLAFVDLPGVINQTEDPVDQWLVKFVKTLVKSYISEPNTLILLACSLETDLAISRAAKLVGDCPGAKERCVGVLTKPDRRPKGDPIEVVRRVLANLIFQVGHGYYTTLQPSQTQLDEGLNGEDARKLESNFFGAHPWNTVLGAYSDRFGTAQLQMALSRKLAGQIMASLPNIIHRIAARLHQVDSELESYPDPPDNAIGHILEALTSFKQVTERYIEGTFPYHDFRNSVKQVATDFKNGLNELRPTLRCHTPKGYKPVGPVTVNLVSDDDSDHEMTGTPCPPTTGNSTAKKRKLEPDTSATSTNFKTPQRTISKLSFSRNPEVKSQKRFSLLEIRETLENLTMSDIPNEIDPRAVDHLRSQCLTGWQLPMNAFLENITTILSDKLHYLLQDSCNKWLNTEFYVEAQRILSDFVAAIMEEQHNYAQRALRLELHKPFTLNDEDIKRKEGEELQVIEPMRYKTRAGEYLNIHEARTGRVTIEAERKKKIQGDKNLRTELGVDPFQREIEVMAKVRGYYRVALLRFLDHVVQGVQVEVFEKCRNELSRQLKLGLELGTANDHQICTRLLAEDPAREVRRVALKTERQKLVEAQQWLAGLDITGF